jgi:hypothetical protein
VVYEIKTVPYTPLSHPFVERLIGTIRREYLDQVLFWNASDLERKLEAFRPRHYDLRKHPQGRLILLRCGHLRSGGLTLQPVHPD